MKNSKMKMFRHMPIVALLLIALVLGGCGGSEPETDGQSGEATSAEESGEQESAEDTEADDGEDAENSDNSDDVEHERSLDTENGTMKEDSVVISVGQTPVTYAEYMTYYYFMENQYDSLLGEEVWKQRGEADKSIGQEAIEDVLRMIIQVKVIVKRSDNLGVALEADEKEDADYNAQKFYDTLSPEIREKYMISPTLLMKIFEENRLSKKVYNVIIGQVQSGLSSSEAQAYRVQLLFKAAQADKDKQRSEMEALQSEIASSDKSFYYYAKQETEADTVETVIGALDERKNLWNTLIALKPGTVSSVVEENDGFYIVSVLARPDDALNTEYTNAVVTERQITEFQEQYAGWSRCYDVDVSDSLLSD